MECWNVKWKIKMACFLDIQSVFLCFKTIFFLVSQALGNIPFYHCANIMGTLLLNALLIIWNKKQLFFLNELFIDFVLWMNECLTNNKTWMIHKWFLYHEQTLNRHSGNVNIGSLEECLIITQTETCQYVSQRDQRTFSVNWEAKVSPFPLGYEHLTSLKV